MKHIALLAALVCALCLFHASIAQESSASAPTVSIKAGKLRGSLASYDGAVFKGIPFAQPPVGDLRWHAPLPAKSWTGVRDATAFGPACVQGGAEGQNSSEDCLTLNVWTPAWPMKKPAAVMVWIYGGGNFAGATSDPTFNGDSLARHGVVLVTVNYRLGVFGFFALPALSSESPHRVSGNYGLLDQLLALKWVQANIARFGGDPRNVTIFGESAGSLDVNVLTASPLSKGLFEKVIGESGPVVDPPPLAEAEKKGEGFTAKLNVTGLDMLAKLRAIPTADLQKAVPPGLAFLGPTLGVNVDGWLFPESPMKIFAEGHEQHVGLLLGNNSEELQKPFFPMPGDLHASVVQQYGPLADRALAAYDLTGPTDPAPDSELGPVLAQWATDSQFRCGSVAELIWHTEAGNPGYEFQFSRSAAGREALGAPHGTEVPYVFGTIGMDRSNRVYNQTDRRISEEMQSYWTNFAKTGDPNGESLPHWPAFDQTKYAYLDLTDDGTIAKEGLRRQACGVYMEMVEQKLAQEP
jgi:para-nitrobenzyl esterase